MEYSHHTFETVYLPEEELEEKEIINLKCSEKPKPEIQDLSCSKSYLENLNLDVKDRLCVKPDKEIPSTFQTLHNSKTSQDLPCFKPDLEETKPELQDLNFLKSDSEILFSKPKFSEKSCYAPDPKIVYCTSKLEEDNCIDRFVYFGETYLVTWLTKSNIVYLISGQRYGGVAINLNSCTTILDNKMQEI